MKFQHTIALFVVLAAVTSCTAHISGGQISYQDISPRIYCGRTLARAIALLCYKQGDVEKKSDTGTMYNAILTPYYKEQEAQFDWPWMPSHKARSMGLPSRGKRYVVNECCDKACSVEELLSYC